jgi:DNA polymerase II large subunit
VSPNLIDVEMPQIYKKYFTELETKLNKLYKRAEEARRKGLDASLEVDAKITTDIAERIEKLIGPPGITQRMRELKNMDRNEMSFMIAKEIALGRFGILEKAAAADQAIRTALAIMTEGVTIAPIEGIPEIKIKQNPDRTQYLSVYFAGPIRPAGGTAQALTLVIADIVRRTLNLEKWHPSEDAVNRFIEEVRVYEQNVRRFQYHVTDEDLELAMKALPVEPTGVSTDPYEVLNYRDIPGIETNRVRGGALIVVVDGVVGRARKLCGICENVGIEGWEWLNKLSQNKSHEKGDEQKPTAQFMDEIIVGRPVFSFPNTEGGFRLRYGRSRNTGLAACGIHPATMITLNKFMNTGLQLRVELPGKSAAICPVDSIEPPIVKLKNGSVVRVADERNAWQLYDDVERILFNGDILFNAGDFIQFNQQLLPAGYDEEQWRYDVEHCVSKLGEKTVEEISEIDISRIRELLKTLQNAPSPEEALKLTRLDAPLHPRYTFEWSKIKLQALLKIRNTLADQWDIRNKGISLSPKEKNTLESLLVPHRVSKGRVYLDEYEKIMEKCLALDQRYIESGAETSRDQVNHWAGFTIREKAYVYIGARMGRPEKAKERKMSPYVHSLYPVGNAGGPQRDITRSRRGDKIKVELVNLQCPECGYEATTPICSNCGSKTVLERRCPRCKIRTDTDICPRCSIDTIGYDWVELDLREALENARRFIGGQIPPKIKGVKRLMNKQRMPEHLAKGILRARYDLSVFKDGTLRFDLTDIPLTHFTPKEIGTPVEKLKELGYKYDADGKPLTKEDQMLELLVQDIVLPDFCGDYLLKVSNFLDDEVQDFYKMTPVYNYESRNDLIGEIVLGLAPHTSAAIVGRIVGWTKVRNCYAHPYWHAAKRRNCDGDEDSIMLTLDPLLNFSRDYLPEQSGGLMDAPLFIIPNLNPNEVDKESHNVDVIDRYPPEFYNMSKREAKPNEFGLLVDKLEGRLGTPAQYTGFKYTHECTDINQGSHVGAYNELKTMLDKLESQLDLTKKLRAVNGKIVGLKILNSHFMKDIVGNLRAFTRQMFRCSKCNKKYRRPPLKGVCDRCGGPILQTVYKGGIKKYIAPAKDLIKKYDLGDYYLDRIKLVEEDIDCLFWEEELKETHSQFSLTDFMKAKTKN